MSESRTANSIRNYGVTMVSQIVSIVLNFVGRTFLIKLLGVEYLGVNGLFGNILSLLSLAELGFGTAITYMMYKPIADNNINKVASYMGLFKKIYICVGMFVLIVGLMLTPFIYSLIKDTPHISENLYIIYMLFVVNSAITYFYTYKRSLLIAYQKEYINSQNVIRFDIIKNIAIICVLYLSHNFYLYLLVQISITFLSNIVISQKANKLYPQIVKTEAQPLLKQEYCEIVKNTMAMVSNKVGSVIVSGTGNLFISYFVGITTVGIYSNYVLLYTCVNQIIGKGVNSLTASFGNLVASSTEDQAIDVFKKIYFLNYILAFSTTILFYQLIEPFIKLWIGTEYLLDSKSCLLIVVNALFFYQIRIPSQMVINACGLFWQIKWKSLVEACVCLLLSFFFLAYLELGIFGILLSALCSNILTNIWWEPYVAFKYGFKKSVVPYASEFIKECVILFASIYLLSFVNSLSDGISNSLITCMILRFLTGCIILVTTIIIFNHRKSEFKYALNFANNIIRKKKLYI